MKLKEKAKLKSKKFSLLELSLLCHQLALVLKSGLHPIESIPLIADDIANPGIKASLQAVSKQITAGMPLHEAFRSTGQYPEYMLRMLQIGEKTGMLESVMENLSAYYESEADIKRRVKSAITYPCILAVFMLGVIALLVLKVIPMFGEILVTLGGELPTEAQILFNFGTSLKTAVAWGGSTILLLSVILFIGFKTPLGREAWDQFKVRNMLFGGLYKKILAARLGNGLSITLKSGMNLDESFDVIQGLMNNSFINKKLGQASKSLSEGAEFSEVFKETGLFPELFLRMIRTGERTGSLDSMMNKLSRIYAQSSEISLKNLSGAIEPAIVVILSVVMAVVLLSVLLPLIGIMSSIG